MRFRRRAGILAPVYWILATVFIVILLSQPRLRPLGVVGCVVLGTMLAWGIVQRLRNEDASQAAATQQLVGDQLGQDAVQPLCQCQVVAHVPTVMQRRT